MKRSLLKKLFFCTAVIPSFGMVLVGRVTAQTFTVLHSFTFAGGSQPYAGLIISSNTLYGTTILGGRLDFGTVFKVNMDGTGFTTLHNFDHAGGQNPSGDLILSGNTLYGTTINGGTWGLGTVFAVNTDGTGFTNLHSFGTGSLGGEPYAGVILSGDTLYGTTEFHSGTVFAVNKNGTGFTNLHNFKALGTNSSGAYTNSDGAAPQAGLILSGNTLYGTASRGGSTGNGTVFAVNTNDSGFTTLHSFTALGTNSSGAHTNSDGAGPQAGLILSGKTLYGTTAGGGSSGGGTVFSMNIDGTGFTAIYNFTAADSNSSGGYTNSDGANPFSGLILSGSTLYGTTQQGGNSGYGTVFGLSFAPQLAIALSGPNVVLSWPTNVAGFDYSGYGLQSTTNLVSPVWNTNSPAPVVVNGQNTVTNPISGTRQFYRLSQ